MPKALKRGGHIAENKPAQCDFKLHDDVIGAGESGVKAPGEIDH